MKHSLPILAATALLVAGCARQADYALVDGFEEICEGGVPCLWAIQPGSSGRAVTTETLPGDHALRLEGGPMAIVRETPGIERAVSTDSSLLVADLTVRCSGSEELIVEATVESSVSGEPLTLTGSVYPASWGGWNGTVDGVSLYSETGASTFFTDVLSVRIVKPGESECELAYFALRVANGFE
jgi:hypothetical protein